MLEALKSYLVSWYIPLVFLGIGSLYVPFQWLRLNRDIALLGGRAPAVKGGFLGWCQKPLSTIRSLKVIQVWVSHGAP